MKSEHNPHTIAVGYSKCNKCQCQKFTWVAWVIEKEVTKAYFPLMTFKDGTEAITAVKQMSTDQKERMLMDLVWKLFVKPKGLTTKQVVTQAYNVAMMIHLNEN